MSLRKNSHWIILAYGLLASGFTYFNSVFGELPDALLFYLVLPSLIIVSQKGRLRDHGLSLGNWRQGALWTLAFVSLSIATVFVSVKYIPGIRQYYRHEVFGPALVCQTVVYMTAWEFFFRGFLLFGLKKLGFAAANSIQTLLFFLMHIGKPGPELYSTLLTGLVFGYLTYKCRSVIPMIIIHSSILLAVVLFAKM